MGFHVDGVVVSQNGLTGMQLSANPLVLACTASTNVGTGIFVAENSAVESCLAVGNADPGICTGARARVTDCTATENGQDGCVVSGESLVRDSRAFGNRGSGFRADVSSIMDCISSRNGLHGIAVVHSSLVRGCTASHNGKGENPTAVGILAEGTTNLIERKQTVFNGIGHRAAGTQNFFSGNTSQSEGGFQLDAGNVAGPILTAGTLATATNPTSNFDL